MKINRLIKSCFLVCVVSLSLLGRANAVDLAAASTVMEEVESMSASVKQMLADAALKGDTDAVMDIQKREAAIDLAVTEARDAFAKLELHIQNDEIDAAETAGDELAAALVKVRDALMGAVPELVAGQDSGEESENLAGGGPSGAGDPPDIHEVPWKSQGIKDYYQSLFGEFWNASAFGHGQGPGDFDATPE